MEKKISSTSSKLRSLKEFLSSTRSLNHQNYEGGGGGLKKPQHCTSNFRSSIRNTKNSISLFNLIAANGNERLAGSTSGERPISMALDDQYGYAYEDRDVGPRLLQNKSVSMYGLTPIDPSSNSNADSSNLHPASSTRNLAARLFYNIRSKFRRRRRDRSRIVDSAEFGALFPEDTSNANVNALPSSSIPINSSSNSGRAVSGSARYQLTSANSIDVVVDDINLSNNIDDGALTNDEDKDNANNAAVDAANVSVAGTSRGNNNFEDLGLTLKLLAETVECGAASSTMSIPRSELTPNSGPALSPAILTPTSPKPTKCLTKELEDLLHYGWYWGSLSKEEAEAKLKDQPDGAFVVRDSSSDHYLLSLSFNSNRKTLHTRIEYRNGQFCFYMSPDSDSFNTVAELIQHCIAYSEVGIFCYSKPRRSHHNSTSYPVRLTKPISRFTEVKSLLYLSRLKIRQYVRFDLIPLLPLPSSLIEYVSEQRYI